MCRCLVRNKPQTLNVHQVVNIFLQQFLFAVTFDFLHPKDYQAMSNLLRSTVPLWWKLRRVHWSLCLCEGFGQRGLHLQQPAGRDPDHAQQRSHTHDCAGRLWGRLHHPQVALLHAKGLAECVTVCVVLSEQDIRSLTTVLLLLLLLLTEQTIPCSCNSNCRSSRQRDRLYSNKSTVWPPLDAGGETSPLWVPRRGLNSQTALFQYAAWFIFFLSAFLSVAVRGAWQSGFFDQGSFMEIMESWARTVVTGRAR